LRKVAPNGVRHRARPAISAHLALEAVTWIDAIFDRQPRYGADAATRLAVRRREVTPLVTWMRDERARLSRRNPVAKAMDYMLTR
jgi:transposase